MNAVMKETVLQTALQREQKARPEGGEALEENVDALGQRVHKSQWPRQTKSKGEIPAQPPARKEPIGLGRSNDLSREEAKCRVGGHQARCDDQPYFHIHMNLWGL